MRGWAARTLTYLMQRKRAYQLGIVALLRRELPTPAADMMMSDLARFCRAVEPPIGLTVEATYRYLGRLEVFRRITEHLHLTPEELYRLYSSHRPPTETDQ